MAFLVLLAIISLFASVLHGLSGMGFPLLATTALSLAMPLTKTVALLAIPTLLINLWVVFAPTQKPAQTHSSSPPTIRPYLPLIIASVVGGVLGVRLLLFLPTVWLTLLLGITILLSSLHGIFSLKNKPLPKKNHPPTQNTANAHRRVFGRVNWQCHQCNVAHFAVLFIFTKR